MLKADLFLKEVAERLKEARINRRLNINEVAAAISVNARQLELLEMGKVNFTLDILCQLAKIYEISSADLLSEIYNKIK